LKMLVCHEGSSLRLTFVGKHLDLPGE
jgi:hypothetical protein